MLLQDFLNRFLKNIISEDNGWLLSIEFKIDLKKLSRQSVVPSAKLQKSHLIPE